MGWGGGGAVIVTDFDTVDCEFLSPLTALVLMAILLREKSQFMFFDYKT